MHILPFRIVAILASTVKSGFFVCGSFGLIVLFFSLQVHGISLAEEGKNTNWSLEQFS